MVLPASARTLELYAIPGESTAWQYLKLDLQTNTLMVKRIFPFPQITSGSPHGRVSSQLETRLPAGL